jgi:nitroreductase
MTRADRRKFLVAGAGVGASLAMAKMASPLEAPPTPATLPFFDVIRQRRSVRQYKTTPVPEEHLQLILDAARLAPTSGNQQPWKLLVVRDRAKVERIKQETLAVIEGYWRSQGVTEPDALAKKKADGLPYVEGLLTAPVFVLVLVDKQSTYPSYNEKDGSLAAAQLILAARALGYGTVFLTDGIPVEATKRALAIPDRYERIAMIPIGLPNAPTADGWPASPPKKPLDQVVAYETLT